ncbi:hypothetical protein ACEUZ9_001089 [Paracoccus litorisediminis]|uniref:hypothetical protein n=1 Tax=Paracoccus litorisediminis TaxID=2006130 RepID=UPI00372F661F
MDRTGQLKNVAFGGAWSQSIPRRERFADAVARLRDCPERSRQEDLREDTVLAEAITLLCDGNPKGETLIHSWQRALSLPDPALRRLEIARLVRAIEAWVGE